ncbi:MAG: hypothetical protein ABII18_02985 [bacterium]
MKKFLLIVFSVVLISPLSVQADPVTHAIGTTGYMIREAMQARANKVDKVNYRQAIRLQREAKRYLHGTHKKGRHIGKVVPLTLEAYTFAKNARDNALRINN